MKVQTRFETTLNGELTDVLTTITVDAVPVNTIGYLTIGRGTANEEDIKYLNISGLQLVSCLRGLSKTALTDTEVLANKKAHSDGETVESTIVHYIVNEKTDRSEDEIITGQWSFDDARSSDDSAPTEDEAFTNKKYVDDNFFLKADIDTDDTLSANSDTKVPSQKAIKKFVEDEVAGVADFPQPLATAISDVTATASEVNQLSGVSFITDHTIYTPAYLTTGTSATSNYLLWGALTDGSFRCTIDGTLRNITGINTVDTVSMADVASRIQTAIRAVTGGLETCVWSTNKFIITSGNTTSSSAITVLSAVGSGTDISGATAGDPNMDGDTGNGVVTNKVINASADSGKIGKLNAEGNYSRNLLQDFDAKGDLYVGSGNGTGTLLGVGTNGKVLTADSVEAGGLKWVAPKTMGNESALHTNADGSGTFASDGFAIIYTYWTGGTTTGVATITLNGANYSAQAGSMQSADGVRVARCFPVKSGESYTFTGTNYRGLLFRPLA